MAHPMPLSFYIDSEANHLHFHLLSVGEGLMFLLIFPDQTTMLFDSNVTSNDEDKVIDYLTEYIPVRYDYETRENAQWIDIFVNSHRDEDHYRGLSKINSEFNIKSIWDSGETGETTQSDDYKYYMALRRRLREKYGEDAVIIPTPSFLPLRNYGGAEVYCFNSSMDYDAESTFMSLAKYESLILARAIKEAKVQHTNSIVLSIWYAGRSILLTGDSDWQAWRDRIVPNFAESGLLKSNVLVASHHGSRSFFTDEK